MTEDSVFGIVIFMIIFIVGSVFGILNLHDYFSWATIGEVVGSYIIIFFISHAFAEAMGKANKVFSRNSAMPFLTSVIWPISWPIIAFCYSLSGFYYVIDRGIINGKKSDAKDRK